MIAPAAVRELSVHEINWSLPVTGSEQSSPSDFVVDVVVEAQSYRLLAQQAVRAVYELRHQHDRLRANYFRLVAEHRGIMPERSAA
jgi:hypothetical protein